MPIQTIYALGESQITVSGGGQLSGETQGDGGHLAGLTITLNSNAWEAIAVDETQAGDTTFADSDASQRLDGAQTFDGTAYGDNRLVEAEYQLTLRDPSGNEYTVLGFNINEAGSAFASYGTVEGLAFVGGVGGFPPVGVPLTVVNTTEGPSYAYSSLATPPCFTEGTKIDTPRGPVAIEALGLGDRVLTRDTGAQPVAWIGRTRLPRTALIARPEFCPVLIEANAFGPGVPVRDTRLSPQHRVLIDDWRAAFFFGCDEILVPAKKLVNDTTIRECAPCDVTYFHLAFDRHEVIRGDGLPSESYLPGDAVTAPGTAAELDALFGGEAPGAIRAARRCISDRTAALIARAA